MPFRDPQTGEVFKTIRDAVENYRCPGPCAECPLGQKVGGINACDNGKWFDDHPIETARLMGYEVIDDKEVNMDKQDKPLSEWTLGEAKAECCGRTPANKTKCVECPLIGKVCYFWNDELEVDSPDGWKIDGKAEAKPEREGLGPSPTRETEAPDVDVGAGSKPARPRLAELLGVDEDEKWRYPECAGLYRVHNGVREYWDENNGWLPCDCEEVLLKIVAHPELIIRLPRLTEPEIERCRVYGAKWVFLNPKECFVTLCKDRPEWDETHGLWLLMSKYIDDPLGRARDTFFPSVHPGECIGLEEAAHALKNPG